MNKEEKEALEKFYTLMSQIQLENANFRKDTLLIIDGLKAKVDKKHVPMHLEQDILQTAQQAIQSAIKNVLESTHNSPLIPLIRSVVDENSTELRQIISDSFKQVIQKEEFKQSIINAFSHKVAKTIISNNDGLFDKIANELKQDSLFKSKMMLAVAHVVEECLIEKKKI
jgi:hypothetical protein